MPPEHFSRRLSYVVLCASLVLVIVVFGVRATYTPGVYYALVVVQISAICLPAWKLGGWAIRGETVARRRRAVAGGLLLLPFALFSLLAGFGTPWQATPTENQLRYLMLLIAAIAVAGGLVVLREALSEAGERFYSTMGFAAIMLASPLYLIWAAILRELFGAEYRESSDQVPAWIKFLSDLSDILLFFGGVLTYLATAAFAASLGRIGWLGRGAARAFVTVSFMALVCVAIRGLPYPNPTGGLEWYAIPGFIAGIPAIPWIMPFLFGVALLRRAGDEQTLTKAA